MRSLPLIIVTLALILGFSVQAAVGQPSSHIQGNVPAPADFHPFLERDLCAYFHCDGVRYDLLRQEPTQSGVAYRFKCSRGP